MQALLERARRKKEEEEAKKLDPDKQQQLQEKFAKIQLPETSLGPPEIDPSEITIEHVLGDGSFGTVYQGQCRSKKVAVKKLIKQNLDERELQDFRREIEILSSIFSPNICLFMGACTTPGNLMIVTELMRSDLERLLQDEGVQLTLFTRIKMGKEIALGMNWLHQNKPPIIHRDLKPSNILVDENLNVKVSDFGLSQIKWTNAKLSAKGEPGSAYWMAPEVLMGKEYTEKCDVYSFGIVLWELLTRKEPFEEDDDWDTFLNAVCKQNQRPVIPPGTNPGLKALIEDCWSADDTARPPFSTIVKRLDTILIDIAVMDMQANVFWKKYFPTRDQVPWKDFINELGRFLKLTSCINFSSAQRWVSTAPVSELIENHTDLLEGTNLAVNVRCLKSLVADKPKTSQGVILDSEEEVVGLEKFGNAMNWFGPMKIPNSPNEETVLDKIREVLACNWFHGDIGTKEAERMLMGEIPGRFFVRFSTTTPGGFTISKIGKKPTDSATSIRHQRISHSLVDDKYTVHPSNRSYNTLQDLIAVETSELQLLHPYPGSKYLSLFVEQEVSGYKEEPSQQPGDKGEGI